MNKNYEEFRAKVFSAMRGLAKDCPEFSDAEMLVAASDVTATLKRSTVHKNIDVEWVDRIEEALPYLDLIVRRPTIMIEDVDEILPVELSRNIAEKTIKHLAQHTNMILTITEKDEVIPQKLLNVHHEETLLTYENKFINTLLMRLSAFVDKRYKFLKGGNGIERNYQFRYSTEFEHYADAYAGRNLAKVQLAIDLASPISEELSEAEMEANERYIVTLERIKKISNALMSYMSSPYVRALGRNYIRPPVIRTNAILKNKNMRVCLNLWEYIESFDRAGYSFVNDEFTEVPSDNYVSDLYSSIALQYTDFYNGVAENAEDNRILANRHLSEVQPDFDSDFDVEDLEDYSVYDSEYKKMVPVSRLMNNRKKLSEDERRIRMAIMVSLKADEILHEEELAREAEERRIAREKRLAEEEERRRAEEEARRLAEEEARRLAEEEAKKAAEEEARKLAEEEARRAAEEEEARRLAAAALSGIVIRYKRSFLARYIQAEPQLQDYYTTIKNELLSYDGVKSRISWSKETYKRGRAPIAKIDIKGKSLIMWLALDPAQFENTKYHFKDVSDRRIGESYPMLIKVRSPRSLKYALELIAKLMETLGIERIEREFEDFHREYLTDEVLIEMGLIKVVLTEEEAAAAQAAAENADEQTESAGATEVAAAVEDAEDAEEAEDAEDAEEIEETDESEEIEESAVVEEPVVVEEIEEPKEIEETAVFDDADETDGAVRLEMPDSDDDVKDDNTLAVLVDNIINDDGEGKYIVVGSGESARIVRNKNDSKQAFGFADTDDGAEEGAVRIPYTRAQYLALPRKKKKSVLTNVKKMISYRNTLAVIELLKSRDSDNPRIQERIRILEEKLAEEAKALPKAELWEASVQRVKR